jgi:hypothetical protein
MMNKTRPMLFVAVYFNCKRIGECVGWLIGAQCFCQCLVSMFRSTGDHQRRKTSLTSELRSRAHACAVSIIDVVDLRRTTDTQLRIVAKMFA